MKRKWLAPALLVAMALTGAAAYGFLPAHVPIHWNAAGAVDGYTSRFWGVALLPLVGFGIWLLLLALPRLDPRAANYQQFAGTYQLIINAAVAFIAALYLFTIMAGLGIVVAIPRIVGLLVGMLFVAMGNELGRVAPNYFVGVRTPWTLADPEVWRKTHRVAGRTMVSVGLLNLVAAVLLPESAIVAVVIGGTLGFAAIAVGYSYWLWQRLHSVDGAK